VMGGMIVSLGSTKLPLGLLQAAMGNHTEGTRFLQEAADRNASTGNELMRVFAVRELGAALLDAGETDAARERLDDALAAIVSLGLRGLEARARVLRSQIEDAPTEPNAFRREGDTWALTFNGATVRLRDVKGLGDIACLLAMPGRDVHVAELVAAAEGSDPGAVATVLNRSREEAIDEQAREAYRKRIAELHEELDDATLASDLVRAERAKDDLDALIEQLTGAYGLRGRPRRTAADAERARKAVGWRIRDAIRRVEAVHADLAEHLRTSLQLGTFCAYRPASDMRWMVAP
jgi:tetratricopeptide (TPR) repeat protein